VSDEVRAHENYDADAIQPGIDELLQEEYPGPAVPVRPVGPVPIHKLPARVSTSRLLTVAADVSGDTSAAAENIATDDLRREYLTIICTGNPIIVAHERQAAIDGTGAVLPVNIALTLPTGVPVWVRCATPAASSQVSYWSGNWAD
jgi:hypothetical protein